MGKFLLSLFMALTVFISANAESYYTITFTIGTQTTGGPSNVSDLISDGADFVSSIKTKTNVICKTKDGVSIGSNSNPGKLVLTLSESGTKKVTKFVLKTAKSKSGTITMNVNSIGTQDISTAAKDYTFTPKSISEISEITIEASKKSYLKAIEVYYEDGGEIIEPDNRSENGLAYEQDSYTATFGEDFVSPTIINPNNLPLMYSSSDETVATVDAEGKISLVAAGKTTITASFAGNETYKDGKVSYSLTVNKAPFKPGIPILSENQAYYFIVFKNAESDGTNDIDSNGLKEQILTGSDYYANASNISKVYSGINGLKFSTGSKNGSITIALSELGKVKADKIIVNAVNWLGTNGYDAGELSVNGLEAQSLTNELAEYTFTLDGTSLLENIILSATKRIYVKSLTIVYNLEPLALPEIICDQDLTNDIISATNNVTVNFKKVEGIDIYYKINSKDNVNTPTTRAVCEDPSHSSYTLHQGEDIELNNTHSSIEYMACEPATGRHSALKTLALDITTGVAEIEAAGTSEVRWFDMQGREVKGQPEKGIYVRVVNGKASKVIL